jgi:RND family efflux transporter MFP subunit
MTTRAALRALIAAAGLGALPACGDTPEPVQADAAPVPPGQFLDVRDSSIAAVLEASGVAEPVQRATLSTRLMGTITAVLVQEGARVTEGQVLARIDARDLAARRAQADAGIGGAEAVHADALVQAERFRALYADSAATRAQLDAAETGLARADAALRTARAASSELEAVAAYAQVRAPFSGVVTQRFVDRGAFVAPGEPIVAVEDGSRLRISVTVAPGAATSLAAGARLDATIEGRPAVAVVEGVAPSAGALYTVNALVANADRQHPTGGVATLRIPLGVRTAILVPAAALVREGDLTGVRVQSASGLSLRWVRLGVAAGESVEVLSGLKAGDRVFVPSGGGTVP